jgi:hypothetical protein
MSSVIDHLVEAKELMNKKEYNSGPRIFFDPLTLRFISDDKETQRKLDKECNNSGNG